MNILKQNMTNIGYLYEMKKKKLVIFDNEG